MCHINGPYTVVWTTVICPPNWGLGFLLGNSQLLPLGCELLLHVKIRMPPFGSLQLENFRARPIDRRPQVDAEKDWRDYSTSSLTQESFLSSWEMLCEMDVWTTSLNLSPPWPDSRWKWSNGRLSPTLHIVVLSAWVVKSTSQWSLDWLQSVPISSTFPSLSPHHLLSLHYPVN